MSRARLGAATLATACLLGGCAPVYGRAVAVMHDGVPAAQLDVAVAADEASREQRPMGQRPGNGQGMEFVRDGLVAQSFWMRDTAVALDLVWVDEQGVVVDKATMVPCRTPRCAVYSPVAPAAAAVEAPAGTFAAVRVGDVAIGL